MFLSKKNAPRAEFEARLKQKNADMQRHARLMLSLLDRDGALRDRYPYPVQVWRFGGGLLWITMGGEVVVDYSALSSSSDGTIPGWQATRTTFLPISRRCASCAKVAAP